MTPPLACEHDWRVNPLIQLTSYPPRQQQVCARCLATRSVLLDYPSVDPSDPKTWPKAESAKRSSSSSPSVTGDTP